MAKVYILCGKIASGKTYYAHELKERIGGVILSVDDLVLKLADSCLGEAHNDITERCERYFYQLSEQLIGMGINVIIDYGYWNKNERNYAKLYFIKRKIEVELHYCDTDDETRKKRLLERNNKLQNGIRINSINERVYIIDEELRERLDLKFEKPMENEIDVVIK